MELIISGVIGFVVGVMTARNLNAQDRAFWKKEGAEEERKNPTPVLIKD
jgi:hypothetical protein